MLVSGGSPYRDETFRFLPAFLFSHGKWFRSAISHDSFPPGEAFVPSAHKLQSIIHVITQIIPLPGSCVN